MYYSYHKLSLHAEMKQLKKKTSYLILSNRRISEDYYYFFKYREYKDTN